MSENRKAVVTDLVMMELSVVDEPAQERALVSILKSAKEAVIMDQPTVSPEFEAKALELEKKAAELAAREASFSAMEQTIKAQEAKVKELEASYSAKLLKLNADAIVAKFEGLAMEQKAKQDLAELLAGVKGAEAIVDGLEAVAKAAVKKLTTEIGTSEQPIKGSPAEVAYEKKLREFAAQKGLPMTTVSETRTVQKALHEVAKTDPAVMAVEVAFHEFHAGARK
jgi:hypothetical protein